jgi:hypothetical protein
MAAVAGEDGRVEYRYRTPPRSTREQTTMEQLQSCFDLESAERFFEKNAEKSSSDGYVICNGVPVETWNCFLDQREEDLPIPLRFIEYYDGKIIIIELPCGYHEDFIREFE